MNQLRIIHTLEKDAPFRERIQFTEDLAADASDFIAYGFELMSDSIADIDLPSGFPSEHEFTKSN
jgi:hypothetical protein